MQFRLQILWHFIDKSHAFAFICMYVHYTHANLNLFSRQFTEHKIKASIATRTYNFTEKFGFAEFFLKSAFFFLVLLIFEYLPLVERHYKIF